MKYREFFNSIKKMQFDKLYLFCGEEEYIKEQGLNQMIEALIPKDMREFNYQLLDGSEADANSIINACETLPFLCENRLVVIKDSFLFGNKKDQHQEKQIKDYLLKINSSTCLVFYNRGNVDKRKSLYTLINKNGSVVEFDRLSEHDLVRWIASTVRKGNKEISNTDIQYLIYLAGSNMDDLNNEINKLISYVDNQKIITKEVIEKVVTRKAEHTIFELVEAVGQKNSGQALMLLDKLLYEGQAILAILAMIARQFRLIYQCKILDRQGYLDKDIAGKLKLHPFVTKKCIAQGNNFTNEQLQQGLRDCLEVDYGIKSGQVRDRLGVELLIIKMCGAS